MDKDINVEHLTTIIAQEIRTKGLNKILDLDSIKEKVLQKIGNKEPMQELETPNLPQAGAQFPQPDEDSLKYDTIPTPEPEIKVGLSPGEEHPLGHILKTPEETEYKAPLPDMLKDIEPAKIFVYDMGELSDGGENLATKPFKEMDNPDTSKSMRDYWSQDGKTKANVYIAKFEKLGEVDFDYRSGTAKFMEKRFDPDFETQQSYKNNPYQTAPTPTTIATAVDVQSAVKDAAIELLKNAILGGVELTPPAAVAVQESKKENKQCNLETGECSITREEITKIGGDYIKIDTPKAITEAIKGKQTSAKVISENDEVSAWQFEDTEYFFLANPIHYDKCYFKKKSKILERKLSKKEKEDISNEVEYSVEVSQAEKKISQKIYDNPKGRELFKKGDKVRFKHDSTNLAGYNADKIFTVLEDEDPKQYSGLYLDDFGDSGDLVENSVIFKLNGKEKKGYTEFNEGIPENDKGKKFEVIDSETKEKHIIDKKDIIGTNFKDYIFQKA